MATHTISAETMLAGLQDIRIPAQTPGGIIAEVLVVVGCGLAVALLISVSLEVVMRPRPRPQVDPPLKDRVKALAALPEEDRALALLALIRERMPEAMPAMRAGLYTRDGFPQIETLEAMLLSNKIADV